MKPDNSALLVNGRLIDSDPLPTKDGHGSRVISLPGFYGALFNNTNDALALAQTNDFTFEMHYERTRLKAGRPRTASRLWYSRTNLKSNPHRRWKFPASITTRECPT